LAVRGLPHPEVWFRTPFQGLNPPGARCVHEVRLVSMVLESVHRVACATDMVQSQSWEPVSVAAAVKTGECGWYTVQVLLSADPAENPQDKVRNTSLTWDIGGWGGRRGHRSPA